MSKGKVFWFTDTEKHHSILRRCATPSGLHLLGGKTHLLVSTYSFSLAVLEDQRSSPDCPDLNSSPLNMYGGTWKLRTFSLCLRDGVLTSTAEETAKLINLRANAHAQTECRRRFRKEAAKLINSKVADLLIAYIRAHCQCIQRGQCFQLISACGTFY